MRGMKREMPVATPIAPMFYSRAQVAELLGCSLRTVDYLRESGELKFVKLGKSVKFPVKSLETFCKSSHATRKPDSGVGGLGVAA
jgi:excisionase family DNA binding protein